MLGADKKDIRVSALDLHGNGTVGLRIPSAAYYPEYYSVEYRSSTPFTGPDENMNRGAIVRLFNLSYQSSRLIDAGASHSPNNFNLSSMTDGQQIGLAYDHLTITQLSHDFFGANLRVTLTPDTTPPSVTISDPVNGSTPSTRFWVMVNATDDMVVDKVELYKNGALFGTFPHSPNYYDFQVDISGTMPGTVWNFQAKAYDMAGNSALSSPVSYTITPETIPPYVSIDNPSDGTLASGSIFVQVSSYDNSGQLCSIDLYADGVLYQHDGMAMGEFNFDLTPYSSGSVVALTALATDCAGNTSMSPPVHITIE